MVYGIIIFVVCSIIIFPIMWVKPRRLLCKCCKCCPGVDVESGRASGKEVHVEMAGRGGDEGGDAGSSGSPSAGKKDWIAKELAEPCAPKIAIPRLICGFLCSYFTAVIVFALVLLPIEGSFIFEPTTEYDPVILNRTTHSFKLDDGTKITAWLVPYQGEKNSSFPLVYHHGSGASIGADYRQVRAGHIMSMGFDVFMYDYPGYGKSEGSPNMQNILESSLKAVDKMAELSGVDADQVMTLGRSMGCSPATHAAFKKKSPIMLLQSCYTTLPDVTRYYYPFAGWGAAAIQPTRFNNLAPISGFTGKLWQSHGRDDTTTPFFMGEELFAAADRVKSDEKQFVPLDNYNHGEVMPDEEIAAMRRWVDAQLSFD
eukprot:PLAT15395.1.p2 GENE.PLAT15395.1~~PLAT15395.1.p2  ORF type:complete len:386 (-),score=150.04 PLAT15395.1:870-1982(-)